MQLNDKKCTFLYAYMDLCLSCFTVGNNNFICYWCAQNIFMHLSQCFLSVPVYDFSGNLEKDCCAVKHNEAFSCLSSFIQMNAIPQGLN